MSVTFRKGANISLGIGVIKYHDQGNLMKKGFILAYRRIRRIRVHHGREARQQAVGIVTGGGSLKLLSSASDTKQRERIVHGVRL